MTIDWFVLLTPLLLLLVVLPVLSVGCTSFGAAADAPTVGSVAGPGLGITTTFILNMDPNIHSGFVAGRHVVGIDVTWRLESTTGGAGVVESQEIRSALNTPTGTPQKVDPVTDVGAVLSRPTAALAGLDRVRCECTVRTNTGGVPPVDFEHPDGVLIVKEKTHVFRIMRRVNEPGFRVFFDQAQ